MSKKFAIPIEKCISIKENVFNNNQYKTVSVASKTFYTQGTQDVVFERKDTLYNINEDQTSFDKMIDDYVSTLKEEVNGTTFTKYIKRVSNTNIYQVGSQNNYDYKQDYIEFSGETSYFGFDVNNIGFGFKAYSNITITEKPYTTSQSDIITVVNGIRFKKAIQEANSLSDTNYIITEYQLEEDLGRDNIDYFRVYYNMQESYYYYQNINSSNVFKATITNGVLDDTQHEMFIQYKIDALNNKVYYYVCMLLNETRKDTVMDGTTGVVSSRLTVAYRTNVADTLFIYDVFEQGEDTTFKTGTGAIADYELSSNNLINNTVQLQYIIPNTSQTQTNYAGVYGTQMTKNFYENGVPTVEITLPIMSLEDLDGNVVVLGTGANAQNIVVGDTFKITKNGTWDNLKMYQVTTVETCFNGAYRWVIKAKETYELIDIRYFVPQLKVGRHKENQTNIPHFQLANVEDFEKIMTKTGLEKNDFQVGIIIKRNHCLKSDRRDYGGGVYSRSHTTTFQKIHLNNGSDNAIKTNYILEFGTNYRIKGLFEIIYDSYLKPTNKKYYLKPERGIYKTYKFGEKMYNLIGVCFKQSSDYISKKSKQFIVIERTIANQPQNDILSSSTTLYEKFNNLTW